MKAHEIVLLNLLLLSAATCLFTLAAVALGTATAAHKIVLICSALIALALLVWVNTRGDQRA